jgi:hypothetical protein
MAEAFTINVVVQPEGWATPAQLEASLRTVLLLKFLSFPRLDVIFLAAALAVVTN